MSKDETEELMARVWVGIILAVAICSVAYRALLSSGMEQTAVLFIGLPTLLALFLVNSPKATSPLGRIMKGMTLALLLSGILAVEGAICILVASPLFYSVGLVIGLVMNRVDRRRTRCSIVMVLAFMSLEGAHDRLSFNRQENIVVTSVLACSPAEVRAQLGKPFPVDSPLPFGLRLGFPQPVEAVGQGVAVGDTRGVLFAGGEGDPGWLRFRIAESEESHVKFVMDSDDSHIAHWLTWQDITMSWRGTDSGHTEVRCDLRYRRELDPAWYFGPIERLAVRSVGHQLLQRLLGT